MNFKDLSIKTSYISYGEDNIAKSLVSPALKLAKLYQRSVAFFSSSVFKLIINSLPDFISNSGLIQLIISPNLSEDDIKAIQMGYLKKEDTFEKKAEDDFVNSLKDMNDEDLEVLYQLVSGGILDVKVACVKEGPGIYHDKLGILTDKDNNKIVFYGSPNSSFNAYVNNYEKIRVVQSWDGLSTKSVEDEKNEFDKLWNNCNEFLDVYDFKDAIINNIINEIKERKSPSKKSVPDLYEYQKEAVSKWIENGYKGFFVMATGTGKTWTAIYSIKSLVDFCHPLVVILAPYKHLINQWERDLFKMFPDADITKVYSDNTDWRKQVTNSLLDMKYNDKQVILLSTIASFYSDDFQQKLDSVVCPKLLVVDEAHRFTRRDEKTRNKFDYFLGLSATPSSGKEYDQKDELLDFFGGKVFYLPIEFALEKHFLAQYSYHPIYVYATDKEEEDFRYWSKIIASLIDAHDNIKDHEKFMNALRNRLRIISMAENKNTNIDDILMQFKNKQNFIVYCGDGRVFDSEFDGEKHVKFIKSKLDKIGIKSSQFTATEDANTRMKLIDSFNDRLIDALVAIKCLDEGVDIPSITDALILSSNDNYREFVQRRGRILRRYKDKEIAHIYDLILLPSKDTPGMAEIEFRRFYEYARLAVNFKDLETELYSKLAFYGLTLDDIKFKNNEEVEADLDE